LFGHKAINFKKQSLERRKFHRLKKFSRVGEYFTVFGKTIFQLRGLLSSGIAYFLNIISHQIFKKQK